MTRKFPFLTSLISFFSQRFARQLGEWEDDKGTLPWVSPSTGNFDGRDSAELLLNYIKS